MTHVRELQDPHVVLVYDTEHVRQVFGPYEGKPAAEQALTHLKTWPTLQDPGWQWDVQPCHQVHPPAAEPRPALRSATTPNVTGTGATGTNTPTATSGTGNVRVRGA